MKTRKRQKRPHGPSACLRTRQQPGRRCDVCHELLEVAHLPLFRVGQFCLTHCPECSGHRAPKGEVAQIELFQEKTKNETDTT